GPLFFGCKDSFNDPNPENIIVDDSISPGINVLNLKNDSVYLYSDTLPLQILFEDNKKLELIRLQLATLNIVDPGMDFSIMTSDSTYLLDTFYLLPQADTIDIDILGSARDAFENFSTESVKIRVLQ